MEHPKTIFCDIDGVLLVHNGSFHPSQPYPDAYAIPDSVKKIREWILKGYTIILTTGRKECLREQTVFQLQKTGIAYDQLIMGVGRGMRVLINDAKPDKEITARAYCIDRNKGIGELEI